MSINVVTLSYNFRIAERVLEMPDSEYLQSSQRKYCSGRMSLINQSYRMKDQAKQGRGDPENLRLNHPRVSL